MPEVALIPCTLDSCPGAASTDLARCSVSGCVRPNGSGSRQQEAKRTPFRQSRESDATWPPWCSRRRLAIPIRTTQVLLEEVRDAACGLRFAIGFIASRRHASRRIGQPPSPCRAASSSSRGDSLNLCDRNRDEVAFILGHEMAHVIRRHAIDRLLTQQVLSAVTLVSPGRGALASWIRRVGVQSLERAYSQDEEFEADELGLLLVRAAHFNPAGADPRASAPGRTRSQSLTLSAWAPICPHILRSGTASFDSAAFSQTSRNGRDITNLAIGLRVALQERVHRHTPSASPRFRGWSCWAGPCRRLGAGAPGRAFGKPNLHKRIEEWREAPSHHSSRRAALPAHVGGVPRALSSRA